jgi:6-phosphofructokinase 1
MVFEGDEADAFGHKKLGGIGDVVASELKKRSPKYNNGRSIGVINQKLGYTVRGGNPDAIDSIAPMAFGNIALDLILRKEFGRLVVLNEGKYGDVPVDIVTSTSKVVDVDKYYNTERYRPYYNIFENQPLFIMASQVAK